MFLNFRTGRRPRGQMLVIVAVSMVALVAITGVVIDGGLAFTVRRQVQNAADAASLAGTRILGADLRARALNISPKPFANPDAAICTAVNEALIYNAPTNAPIGAVPCTGSAGSPEYITFNKTHAGWVGQGSIPLGAQGVRVAPVALFDTLLIRVIGFSTLDVGADAAALVGPPSLPLGKLMPFVVQNPLQPFTPGTRYEVRSDSEGECSASLPSDKLVADVVDATFAMAITPSPDGPQVFAANPVQPTASPDSYTFTATTVPITLKANNGAKIYYNVNSATDPNASSSLYTGPLIFSVTTLLKAVAVQGNQTSNVGTFLYTKGEPPPEAVTASPVSGTTFVTSQSVTLSTTTAGADIYYTTDGTDPTTSSSFYIGPITLFSTTQIKAFAFKNASGSPISSFSYTKQGDTAPPEASPGDGTEFVSAITVTLTTSTPGATIHYTTDGTTPTTSSPVYSGGLTFTSTTTLKAMATAGGSDSLVASFTYTQNTPACPDLTAGNLGWVDFNDGSSSNADLKGWVDDPSSAPIAWYDRICTGPLDSGCRDPHVISDPADDHWYLGGTSGNRDISMEIACKYVDQEIYVPIWDSFRTTGKKPNGANAVFHLIGFAVFKLEGIIDIKANGDPSGKGCGVAPITPQPNDKGFIGTYVDSFIGSQVALCQVSASNPCANLGSNPLTINLAE
jgi:hypothetical protein